MARRATENTKALDAFLAAKFEIDAMLERLAALSANHFDTHPDEIDWARSPTAPSRKANTPSDQPQRQNPRRAPSAAWGRRRAAAVAAPRTETTP